MSQTRKRSAWEAGISTGLAMVYAVPINYLFIQYVTLEPWFRAMVLTTLFTVLSLAHKYWVRRFFNWLDERYPA